MWGGLSLLEVLLALSLFLLAVRCDDGDEESQEPWFDDVVPEPSRTSSQLALPLLRRCGSQSQPELRPAVTAAAGSHTRMYASPDESYKIYHNLWYA